jgi:16S rRNA G966 N2-methylase RsmD
MPHLDIIQRSSIQGNILKLPEGTLDRATYNQVKKSLEGIGGKWKGGKISGFVFDSDPNDLINEIVGGKKINLKKDFQYFPTPDSLADLLVSMAGITPLEKILEPSAGQGAIIKAIQRVIPGRLVGYCELMPQNLNILSKMDNVVKVGEDFLLHNPGEEYDLIIANPPFSKNQDIDHIRHMYNLLKPGGQIVTIASKHWQFAQGTKEVHFRNWIRQLNAKVGDVPAGTFAESGTQIATCIIHINKKQN